jgi:hypothetical protein
VIYVLDPEKFLPGLDQRGVCFSIFSVFSIVSIFSGCGQRQKTQDTRQNRGHYSLEVHGMTSSFWYLASWIIVPIPYP